MEKLNPTYPELSVCIWSEGPFRCVFVLLEASQALRFSSHTEIEGSRDHEILILKLHNPPLMETVLSKIHFLGAAKSLDYFACLLCSEKSSSQTLAYWQSFTNNLIRFKHRKCEQIYHFPARNMEKVTPLPLSPTQNLSSQNSLSLSLSLPTYS